MKSIILRSYRSIHKVSYRKYASNLAEMPKNRIDFNTYKNSCVEYDGKFDKAFKTDHPSFTNQAYRKRREYIGELSNQHKIGDPIPFLEYTKEETAVWEQMYTQLEKLYYKNACDEYLESFESFKKEIGLCKSEIPQFRDISTLLESKTGFIYEPVSGLLDPRYFLNGLAFKIFHAGQYIRPAEKNDFSGEPDIMHEILGHGPMFGNKEFAEFSQDIGIASLFANEEQIKILSNIYWFTIEFGLVRQRNENKIYGAGILGSPFEMEYALTGKAQMHELNFDEMQTAYYDYTSLSTHYFIAPSLETMRKEFVKYAKGLVSENPEYTFDKERNELVLKEKLKSVKNI